MVLAAIRKSSVLFFGLVGIKITPISSIFYHSPAEADV